ncbi:MAG: TetR/AcrR family transcriptional regulator [Methanobrevibacter sp.]|nr:TetR/AcrR family transcriptional regulator [Methanobrevibacter sp.]
MQSMKDKIMVESFKLFLEKGFESVSMSEIKKASGISVGTFYYYFKSKEDLINTVMTNYIFDYFQMALDNMNDFEGSTREEIYYVTMQIIGYDIYKKEWANFYRKLDISDYRRIFLLYLEGVQKYELMSEKYEEYTLKVIEYTKEIVLKGQKNNEIKDGDALKLAKFIQSTIHGTFFLWIAAPEIDLINLMKENLDYLWRNIKK